MGKWGRAAAAVALSLALLATGCSASRNAAPAHPADSPARSTETSIGLDVSCDDTSVARTDIDGMTPDAVLGAYIAALNASDWRTAYALRDSKGVDFATSAKEWAEAKEHYEDFRILEVRVVSADQALARVTYEATVTAPADPPAKGYRQYVVQVKAPGEWWGIGKHDGRWKVNRLARQ